MKVLNRLVLFIVVGVSVLSANAASIYSEIEKIDKGVDGYTLGKELSTDQKELLVKNGIKSDNPNVSKFLVGKDLLIAINSSNNKVIAINKRYNQIQKESIKSMIGSLIHDYDEPTAMAHDKMIYWIYDSNGEKLSEDDLKLWKDSLKVKSKSATLSDVLKKGIGTNDVEFEPYISVKLSSDQPMMSKVEEEKLANVYLMISSDKLITSTTTGK